MKKGFLGKLFGKSSSRDRDAPSSAAFRQEQPAQYPLAYPHHSPGPFLSRESSFQDRHHPYADEYPSPRDLPHSHGRSKSSKYWKIDDDYNSLQQVTDALSHAGLESSNLIVGVDFTKSNTWTGKESFNGLSLHHIGDLPNPYEQAISIIGRTLYKFDEDNLIPCFGFGDAKTHDKDVFSFYPDGRSCVGFEEALSRYREIVPHLQLSGPTSFSPIIEMAMTIVEESGGQYHVLLIIADGQVTGNGNIGHRQLSYQEQKTIDAIAQASQYPLSIVLVGVGDGPWDAMKEFDDNIPERSYDNFQFVNFTGIMRKNVSWSRKETDFALAALMEIPSQYKATLELGILGRPTGRSPRRVALPPPITPQAAIPFMQKASQSAASWKSSSSSSEYTPAQSSNPPSRFSSTTQDNQRCPICLMNEKNMAFGCGHQTCQGCGMSLQSCPICRSHITTRIRLY